MENQHSDLENPFYLEGQVAAMKGFDISENPYSGKNQQISNLWRMGWRSTGKKEIVRVQPEVPKVVNVEPLAPVKKQEIGFWNGISILFLLLIWLGGLFILG